MMNILTPNAQVSRKVGLLLTLGWAALIGLTWVLQPMPIIPNPAEVFSALTEQWQKGLFYDLLTSFSTSIEAIAVATIIGLGISYASTIPLFRPFAELVGKLRFSPLTGMIVIFILLAPNAHWLKVMVLIFAIVVFLVNSMLSTIAAIPQSRYDHARTLGLPEWKVTREVVIRGTMAEAFESLRMNAAVAWMMLTMVEGLSRSEGGIGVLMLNLNRVGDYSAIFAIQILILLLGIGQDWIIKWVKRIVCPYAKG
jgi:NitT/TauT family transport system permease protein